MPRAAASRWILWFPVVVLIVGFAGVGWYEYRQIVGPGPASILKSPDQDIEAKLRLYHKLSEAKEQLNHGSFAAALAGFTHIIETADDADYVWEAKMGAAGAHTGLGDFDEAIQRFEEINENAPDAIWRARARIGTAQANAHAGRPDDAVRQLGAVVADFERAGFLDVCTEALFALARLERDRQRYVPMRVALERIIADFPGNENTDRRRAELLLADVSAALREAQDAAVESLVRTGGAKLIRSIAAGETVTWTRDGGPYVIRADLTVPGDAIVRIEPGTEIRFTLGGGLSVRGRLEAAGTMDAPIVCVPIAGDGASDQTWWAGLRFENNTAAGPSTLRHVRIVAAEIGIRCGSGAVTLQDCEILRSPSVGILSETDGKVSATNCTIVGGANVGVRCEQGGAIMLVGGRVADQGRAGIVVAIAKDDIVIRDVVVENNRGEGVLFRDAGGGTVEGCTIRGNGRAGVQCRGGAAPTLSDCTIVGNDGTGVAAQDPGSNPVVAGSRIRNNKAGGIRFDKGSAGVVRGSVIEANAQVGVRCALSTPAIVGNRIADNRGPGVDILDGAQPVLHGNSLTGNAGPALRNHSSNAIDAVGNWWGTAEAAAVAEQIEDAGDNREWGEVEYQPFLDSAPSGPLPPGGAR